MNFKLIIIFLLPILSCKDIVAQSRIKSFTATQYKESIYINFVITPGQSCSGYQIQRSENLNDFEILHDFSGICGDAVKSQNVSFTDSDPLKSISYYRTFIPPADYSEILTVKYLDFPSEGYILFSNPVTDVFKVLVDAELATIDLFNLKGEKISEFTSDPNGMFLKDVSGIPAGLYHFLIKTKENRVIKGRFIKQ